MKQKIAVDALDTAKVRGVTGSATDCLEQSLAVESHVSLLAFEWQLL